MKCSIGLAVLIVSLTAFGQVRPQIDGISNISVYTSKPDAAGRFYEHDLGLKKASDPQTSSGTRYYLNAEQFVEVLPLPASAGVDRLDHLGYNTSNAEGLREYLKVKGVEVPGAVRDGADGSRWFEVKDPEGNTVQFVQPPSHPEPMTGVSPVGRRMIHVGMLIHSREKEDRFYRDILGFRPYWYGGMNPAKIDWVSQQVPDGHDWLEYMLRSESSDPITQKQLGVLDHFSIGVVNMEKAVTTLSSEDRLQNEHGSMQLGRDGKWQFNLFDPDDVRVELMEYSAVEKPCCSSFTAQDPQHAE